MSDEAVTGTLIKMQLHGQFFTRDCNAMFRNYNIAIKQKKLQPGYRVCQKNLILDILIFLQIFQKLFHYHHKICHIAAEICMCDDNAIISGNCIVIASKKLKVVVTTLDRFSKIPTAELQNLNFP